MKFTVAAIFALAASALAYPSDAAIERRQNNVIPAVDAAIPAMSNARGEVVPFRTSGVYKDATVRGL